MTGPEEVPVAAPAEALAAEGSRVETTADAAATALEAADAPAARAAEETATAADAPAVEAAEGATETAEGSQPMGEPGQNKQEKEKETEVGDETAAILQRETLNKAAAEKAAEKKGAAAEPQAAAAAAKQAAQDMDAYAVKAFGKESKSTAVRDLPLVALFIVAIPAL